MNTHTWTRECTYLNTHTIIKSKSKAPADDNKRVNFRLLFSKCGCCVTMQQWFCVCLCFHWHPRPTWLYSLAGWFLAYSRSSIHIIKHLSYVAFYFFNHLIALAWTLGTRSKETTWADVLTVLSLSGLDQPYILEINPFWLESMSFWNIVEFNLPVIC